jgi:hypothetical protein
MTRDDIRAIEWDCAMVANRFYRALDANDYAQAGALVAADGVWTRQGKRLAGPDAIVEALSKRPPGLTTMHALSNIVVDVESAERAVATFYVTVLRVETAPEPGTFSPVPAPRAVQLCTDRMTRVGTDWKIADKSSRTVFRTEHA